MGSRGSAVSSVDCFFFSRFLLSMADVTSSASSSLLKVEGALHEKACDNGHDMSSKGLGYGLNTYSDSFSLTIFLRTLSSSAISALSASPAVTSISSAPADNLSTFTCSVAGLSFSRALEQVASDYFAINMWPSNCS